MLIVMKLAEHFEVPVICEEHISLINNNALDFGEVNGFATIKLIGQETMNSDDNLLRSFII